jgi:hypothetical protein
VTGGGFRSRSREVRGPTCTVRQSCASRWEATIASSIEAAKIRGIDSSAYPADIAAGIVDGSLTLELDDD